jgi:CelD/BcsL family acetyltransferase involved in cellulose biosynthesis
VNEDSGWEKPLAHAKLEEGSPCPSRQNQHLGTAMLREAEEFAALKDEWDELYESSSRATPFQSWGWLYSWWEAYGKAYDLRLITLREAGSGLLVGLLPLMVRSRPSFGRLLFIGGDKMTLYSDVMTPYKDVLVREGWEEEVACAGVRALKEMGGWRVADLQELMPDSAAWGLFREWGGPKTNVPITDYLLMEARPWEEVLSSLSRRLRKTARRTLRQAERDGVVCEPASAEDAERAADTLVRLHRELWRGRRIAPEHLTPRYEAFVRTAARRMTERGIGRVSEFRRKEDGEVLVSQFLLFDGDFVGVYVTGADEEASGRYQLETLSNWDAIEVAHAAASSERVSFMDGATRDKLRWASEVVQSHRLILGRTAALYVPYAGYHLMRTYYRALRSGAQSYAYSEEAPQWVKKAVERYHALQSYPYSEGTPSWVRSATERYYALRARYGYGRLRYQYESVRARWGVRRGTHLIRALRKKR